MKQTAPEYDVLRRYLLGSLGKEAEESVDYYLMTEDPTRDEAVTNRLSALELDLIDEYLRDELTGDERERFQKHFLYAERRRQQFRFARAFGDHLVGNPSPRPSPNPHRNEENRHKPLWRRAAEWMSPQPAPAWALATAALLIILVPGLAWQFAVNANLEGQIVQMTTEMSTLQEQAQAARQQLDAALARGVGGTVATRLAPASFRDQGDVEEVRVAPGIGLLRFDLDVGIADYDAYRAVLHDAAADEIWSQSKLGAATFDDTVTVTLTLPAELLPVGYYYVSLSGVSASGELEFVDNYYFRLEEE